MSTARALLILLVSMETIGITSAGGPYAPSEPPHMTVDGQDIAQLTEKKFLNGVTARVFCSVEGGSTDVENITLTCPESQVTTMDGKEVQIDLMVTRAFHGASCVCSAFHEITYSLTTTFVFDVTDPSPPGAAPNMTIDGEEIAQLTEKKFVIGDTARVFCTVDGGLPEVENITLTCPESQVKTIVGNEVDFDLPVTRNFHEASCVCSAFHVTQLYTVTSTFVFNVQTIPITPPILKLNGKVIGVSSSFRVGDTAAMACIVEGGNPKVSNVTLNCPVSHNKTSQGNEASLSLIVNPSFHMEQCTCSAQHILGGYTLTTSMTFDVLVQSNITSFTINSKTEQVIDVDNGDNVPFVCKAGGNAIPTVVIEKGPSYQALTSSDESTCDEAKEVTVEKKMTCQDSDMYSCKASNGIGSSVRKEKTVRVKCKAEIKGDVQMKSKSKSELLKALFEIYIYPDPTSYMFYKITKNQRTNKRREVDARTLIDSNDYNLKFSRDNPVHGSLELEWVDLDDEDVLFYELAVQNGLDDIGARIPFNVTRSLLPKKDPSDTTGDSFVVLITLAILGFVMILILCFYLYLVRRGINNYKEMKKDKELKRLQRLYHRQHAMPPVSNNMTTSW